MCGRFTQVAEISRVAERFQALADRNARVKPRYNLAPGQGAAVITRPNERNRVDFFAWGLVPSWAKDPSIGYKMMNARAETLWEKPSYRNAVRYRRCLVPADGFYEWLKPPPGSKTKLPVRFQVVDADIFAFAGLWEVRTDREGGELYTFTIVTTEASPWMRRFHTRMPVILSPDQEDAWLDRTLYRPEQLKPILDSVHQVSLRAYPVSTHVNHAAHDDSSCIEPTGSDYE